jgi:hypothetical protein
MKKQHNMEIMLLLRFTENRVDDFGRPFLISETANSIVRNIRRSAAKKDMNPAPGLVAVPIPNLSAPMLKIIPIKTHEKPIILVSKFMTTISSLRRIR